MNKVDELWEILVDAVDKTVPLHGLYCTPITGGLDSRVLAGIMKKLGRTVLMSYWIRTPDNEINEPHILKLYDLIEPEYFYIIDAQKLPQDFPGAINELSLITPIGMYSFVMALNMDVFTGMLKTKKKEREYFHKTWPKMHTNDYRGFKEVLLPFENSRVVGYLMSLSRWDRLFQSLYMKMINEKLPEYAMIPRCFEKGTGKPTPIDNKWEYMIQRALEQW